MCIETNVARVDFLHVPTPRHRTRLPEKLGAHVCGCGVGGRRRKRRRARDERKNLGEKTPILNHSSHYSCTIFVCFTRYILLLFLFEGQRRGALRVDVVVIKYVRVFRRVIDRVKSPRLLFRFGVCVCALLEGIHTLVYMYILAFFLNLLLITIRYVTKSSAVNVCRIFTHVQTFRGRYATVVHLDLFKSTIPVYDGTFKGHFRT